MVYYVFTKLWLPIHISYIETSRWSYQYTIVLCWYLHFLSLYWVQDILKQMFRASIVKPLKSDSKGESLPLECYGFLFMFSVHYSDSNILDLYFYSCFGLYPLS